MKCAYCGNAVTRSGSSAHLYSGKDFGPVLECRPCSAYVGCGLRSGGVPANRADRELRKHGHMMFDVIWKHGHMSRTGAYRWLAGELGIPWREAHFSMMTGDLLLKAVEVATARANEIYSGGDR